MKKIGLFSPFLLSVALFAQDLERDSSMGKYEGVNSAILLAKTSKPGKDAQNTQGKKNKSSCSSERNYRLPAEFNGFNTFAEALFWQVQEQGSHFVATPSESTQLSLLSISSGLHGNIQSAAFDWNVGIRLGFGYTFKRDAWQALGQYTWYNTEGKNSFSDQGPFTPTTRQVLMATFTNYENSNPSARGLVKASSATHFTYQMADLLLARRLMVNNQLQLTFSLGTTGGYIKENWHFIYQNVAMNTYVMNNWGFGGGGLRTGVDVNWHIGQGFGIFSKLSFAGILGQYATHNRITADSPGDTSFGTITSPHLTNLKYTGIFLLPTTQIALGFDWYRAFTNCRISGIRIAVAGEFNYLSNLQQVFETIFEATDPTWPGKMSARDVGSVYMYGGNARLGADFRKVY